MAVMGGWEIFTRNGGKPGMGGWFYNGEGVIFKVSLHSWQSGANFSILWGPPPTLYIVYPPLFFKFCLLPEKKKKFSVTSNLHPHCFLSVVLFLWLNGWSLHIWFAILLNDNMDLHMSSLGSLVPEGPWCVFYITRHHVY